MSAPRLLDWPMALCTPDSGRITPILSAPPWARTMAGAARNDVAAAAPASRRRRVNDERCRLGIDASPLDYRNGRGASRFGARCLASAADLTGNPRGNRRQALPFRMA